MNKKINMSKILRQIILKNKISFHNIIESQARKKSNDLLPPSHVYELFLRYRTEPYTEKEYHMTNEMKFIPYEKTIFDIKKITTQYHDSKSFVNDIKFLTDWGIRVESIPKEMVTIESINYEIDSARWVC